MTYLPPPSPLHSEVRRAEQAQNAHQQQQKAADRERRERRERELAAELRRRAQETKQRK